jgi:acyl dehydratase
MTAVGDALEPQVFTVTREDLVHYAAASGDDNPIHQDEEVARSVGLPGVIAHGMFTLALAARAVDVWAGGPGRVRDLGAKFTKPVVVPEGDAGTEVTVSCDVTAVDGHDVTVALEVVCAGEKVLGRPTAVFTTGSSLG